MNGSSVPGDYRGYGRDRAAHWNTPTCLAPICRPDEPSALLRAEYTSIAGYDLLDESTSPCFTAYATGLKSFSYLKKAQKIPRYTLI